MSKTPWMDVADDVVGEMAGYDSLTVAERRALARAIGNAIRDAVAAERAACAEIAEAERALHRRTDQWSTGAREAAASITARIRGRAP